VRNAPGNFYSSPAFVVPACCGSENINCKKMIVHYLKLARKALIKHKYYTFVNVFGLVCGMLSALIIAKYIGASLQSDSFHVNKNRIWALTQEQSIDGNPQVKSTATYLGVADLVTRFPDASSFTKYSQHVESRVMTEAKDGDRVSFTENRIFVADSSFLKIFTFPLIHGDQATALSRPNSVVLTESAAAKYFGDTNPIGQTLTMRVSWGRETAYQVTGVAKDIPKLSRFAFDFLITQGEVNREELWNVPQCSIFLLVNENVQPEVLAEKLTNSLKDVPQLKATNRKVIMLLESMADIQLSTEEYLLATVAIFIILISWVNYINQIIAQSYWRIKQIGIFRIMGATVRNLRIQFLVESSLVCLISLALVIGIYSALEQPLQTFTGGHLLPLIGDPTATNVLFVGIFMVGIAVAVGVQATVHFSQDFGRSLQGVNSTKIGGIGLRKALVVVQFSISTVLIISIFVIGDQLEYLETKDKGMNMNDVLVVKAPMVRDTTWNVKRKTLELFKQRCVELPFVTDATSSTTIPSEEYRHETYISLQGSTDKALVHQNGVDDHFFSMYEVEFIAGRDFTPGARSTNRSSIILNESAASALGISDYDNIIDASVVDHEDPEAVYNIVGVVRDYHKTSMKYEVKAMAFKYNEFRGHSSLKINSASLNEIGLAEGINTIKEIWKESYPDAAFDHFFLGDKFAAEEAQDRYFGRLFRYFTVLSVIISCLGLFGLSLLISTKRQKEIGIRKTFGASSAAILAIFLRGYMGPLLVSLLVGFPIAYLMMSGWLENYAYRIEIGVGLVASAVGTLAALFIFTVSFCTIKSSMANPVKVLRE
jgi:putative ABC transport system permease protein